MTRRRGSSRAADDSHDRAVRADVVRPAREDDLAALDDVEPRGELGHVVDVGLGDEDRVAEPR